MVRYTLLRLLVLFGCLALLWLLGLRDQDELPWLVVGAALLSMVLSYVVLRPFREEYVREMTARVERRRAAREGRVTDEQVEDRETGGTQADGSPADGTRGEEPEEYR